MVKVGDARDVDPENSNSRLEKTDRYFMMPKRLEDGVEIDLDTSMRERERS